MSKGWLIYIFESLAFCLAAAAVATRLMRLERRPNAVQAAVFVTIILISLLPIGGLNASQYFLTIAGHLSFTSMCLLSAFLLRSFFGRALWRSGEKLLISIVVLACGILLYLAAFGVITFDVYQLGHGSVGFVATLASLALAAALARYNIAFAVLLSAAAAFQMHLLRSDNIWDHLIDPLLVIYAVASLIPIAVRPITRLDPARSSSENR